MKIIWHGHACFELRTQEGSVVFDPYAEGSVRGLRLPELSADAVICSHGHGDHNAADEVKLTGEMPRFAVVRIPTCHDECMGAKRGKNLITVIEAEGLRVAHCGDLGHTLDEQTLKAVGHVDILMIPVGGFYTIDAKTAKAVCESIDPAMIIPMHYRGIDKGLERVAPVSDFTRLYPTDAVHMLDTNELTVTKPLGRQVTVFAW